MVIITVIKKRSYDLLDHRKMDFEADYEDFSSQVGELEGDIQRFMEDTLDKPTTTQAALQLVKKYQSKLVLGCREKGPCPWARVDHVNYNYTEIT